MVAKKALYFEYGHLILPFVFGRYRCRILSAITLGIYQDTKKIFHHYFFVVIFWLKAAEQFKIGMHSCTYVTFQEAL